MKLIRKATLIIPESQSWDRGYSRSYHLTGIPTSTFASLSWSDDQIRSRTWTQQAQQSFLHSYNWNDEEETYLLFLNLLVGQ